MRKISLILFILLTRIEESEAPESCIRSSSVTRTKELPPSSQSGA